MRKASVELASVDDASRKIAHKIPVASADVEHVVHAWLDEQKAATYLQVTAARRLYNQDKLPELAEATFRRHLMSYAGGRHDHDLECSEDRKRFRLKPLFKFN